MRDPGNEIGSEGRTVLLGVKNSVLISLRVLSVKIFTAGVLLAVPFSVLSLKRMWQELMSCFGIDSSHG